MKTSLTLETLTDLSDIEPLVCDWERLAGQDASEGFFRSPAWYLSWLRRIRPDVTPLVLVVRERHRVVAVAPLCSRKRGLSLRSVTLAGNDLVCGEYLDFPSLSEYRHAAMEHIWERLASQQVNWDLLVLNAIPCEGDLFWEARKRAQDHGWMLRSDQRFCPFIELPSTFGDYLARFSKRRRKHLARAMRIFREEGSEFKTYKTQQELEAMLPHLIELHTLRWQRRGKTGTLGKAGFREFLQDLARQKSDGSLQLHTLELEGIPRAAMLNFHFGESVFQFQNGFDPNWSLARHSPGTVLLLHAIKAAVEERRRFYDFLRGTEEYKFQFADRSRLISTLYLARTFRAKLYLASQDLRGFMAALKPGARDRAAAAGELVFLPR